MSVDSETQRGNQPLGNVSPYLKIYLRVVSDGDIALGPGKADLMDAIQAHGSLSKAGQALGISYRRVWNMVEAINTGFETPLVLTSHGGSKGGGARLSESGETVLKLYRDMQAAVDSVAASHFESIKKHMNSSK